jgi:hypothetical protein
VFISSSSVMLAGRLAVARQKSMAERVQLGPLAPACQVVFGGGQPHGQRPGQSGFA